MFSAMEFDYGCWPCNVGMVDSLFSLWLRDVTEGIASGEIHRQDRLLHLGRAFCLHSFVVVFTRPRIQTGCLRCKKSFTSALFYTYIAPQTFHCLIF